MTEVTMAEQITCVEREIEFCQPVVAGRPSSARWHRRVEEWEAVLATLKDVQKKEQTYARDLDD